MTDLDLSKNGNIADGKKKNRDKNANIRIHIDGMSIYFTITSFLTEKREKKMSRNVTSLIDEWI